MKISGKTKIIIEGLLASLFIIILFTNFSYTISDESLGRNQGLLKELSLRSAKALRDKIKSDEKFLRAIAKNISKEETLISQESVNILNVMAEQTDFTRIVMITKILRYI